VISRGRRLKIAYVTASDARDRRAWSGTHHSICEALDRHCGEVSYIGPLTSRVSDWLHLADRVSRRLSGRRYNVAHSLVLSARYARLIESRLRQQPYDVIFAAVASTEIARLRTRIPIVYLSDGTFALLHDYYPWLTNLSPLSVWEGHRIERAAIAKARVLLYSTEWAGRSAIQDYGAATERIHVIPYGANLTEPPTREEVGSRKVGAVIRLLFLGADWERKGGPIAVETLRALQKRNVRVELTVCGCTPPDASRIEGVRVIPFLDKRDEANSRQFRQLLLDSDLLLVPTRADCSPIVFCEASAYGLPVVSTDTGGVSGVVREGQNGLLLPLSAGGDEYAERIQALLRAEGRYEALARASRAAFEETLNWDAWGRQAARVLDLAL
jgi:glycosyltransferase involved in cell wall biosynthesis